MQPFSKIKKRHHVVVVVEAAFFLFFNGSDTKRGGGVKGLTTKNFFLSSNQKLQKLCGH